MILITTPKKRGNGCEPCNEKEKNQDNLETGIHSNTDLLLLHNALAFFI